MTPPAVGRVAWQRGYGPGDSWLSSQLELNDCEHGISAVGSALHGSENGWHRDTGDYAATVEALLDAGAKALKLTDDLEASQAVRDVLRQHEERSVLTRTGLLEKFLSARHSLCAQIESERSRIC